MEIGIIVVFVLGYLAITMEHTLRIDKLIPALAMMAICWAMIAFGIEGISEWFDPTAGKNGKLIDFSALSSEAKHHKLEHTLLHHLGKTAEILMFLMGAMTIVEITDHYDGFSALKRIIKSKKKSVLLWIMAILAFVLSAIIDNLTATIVLITILRKIVPKQEDRWWFAGMIIVAANAGGAWSPIGDVTTTMLWNGGKVTTGNLVRYLLIPSIVCMLIPTLIASFLPAFKGELEGEADNSEIGKYATPMLILGLSAIIFVPIFKTVTHLPPYVGMMLSLGIVATVAEILSNREFKMSQLDGHNEGHPHSPVHGALSKIEMPSILFFLGILLGVGALESVGHLFNFANILKTSMSSDTMVLLLGGGSAVIDNVPLVAASLSMFNEAGQDDTLWHFIAYAAGTGGSMLIIGSAAGVVAMGMEKISFFWYIKKISLLAILGYLAGAAVFMLMR